MGNPLTVLTTAGSFHGEDSGVEQQLGIEMRLSAVQLRETRGTKPYKFTLLVDTDVDVPQNLSIEVTLFVSTRIVSSLCTFVPPSPVPPPRAPPNPPSPPRMVPTNECLCFNDCLTSDNGICDDDGPGGATGDGFTATCSLALQTSAWTTV